MKILSILLTALLSSLSVFAINVKTGDNLSIRTAIYEDVYVGAGTVTISAPIYGDLVVAGGTIIINDTISGDLIVGGGEVTVNGYIGDDIRGAGGKLYINSTVKGDVVIAGGEVSLSKRSIVEGSVLAGTGTIIIDGVIKDELKCAGGELVLNGIVEGVASCRGEKININGTIKGRSELAASTISLGGQAAFYDDVNYWSDNDKLSFGQAMKGGAAKYDPSLKFETNKWQYLGFASVLGVLWYLSVIFIFILLIQYLFSTTFNKAATTAADRTLPSIGLGLIYFIGFPIAAAMIMITIIGIPVGVLGLIIYMMLIALATVITALLVANWLNNRRTGKSWSYWQLSFVALGLFVVLKLLSFIPFIGWLVMFALACLAFGSILKNIRWKRNTANT